MKIAFWTTTAKKLDPAEIATGKIICGGSEREMLCLAKELHQRYACASNPHPVLVFGNVGKSQSLPDQPLFLDYTELQKVEDLEILIVTRAQKEVLNPRYTGKQLTRKTILWSGDSFDQPNNEILYDKWTVEAINRIVLKGHWQWTTWRENFPLLQPEKVAIIRKGLDLESMLLEPSKADKPKFVYASVAFRGLYRFLEIWPKLKAKLPAATLDCYCKTTLYVDNNTQEQDYKELYEKIGALPGVTIKEPLPQKEFFKILPSYYAMLYPNCGFDETVCGVALESMASGVPVVTSARAGLVETIKAGDGILIEGDPTTAEYADEFVEATLDLWHRQAHRNWMGEYGFRKIREHYGIKETAKLWQGLLDNL